MSKGSVLFSLVRTIMKSIFLLIGLHCVSAFTQETEAKLYSMSDLELMAKNRSWSRVILYIKDVPKSERDLQWKSLLERAAIGYVSDMAREGMSDAHKMVEELEFEFPVLKESTSFVALKDKLVLEGFSKCFSTKSNIPSCAKSAVEFISQKSGSPSLRQNLAKLTISKVPESSENLCNAFNSFKELSGFFEKNCPKSIETKVQERIQR